MDKQLAQTAGKVAEKVIEHTPEPIKDKVKEVVADKAKEKIVENVQDKGHQLTENLENAKEKLADKVGVNAGEANGKTQDLLLSARDKLRKVVEAGEELQKKVSSASKSDDKRKVKGVSDINGIGSIKTSKDIRGATKIKTIKDIRTIGS